MNRSLPILALLLSAGSVLAQNTQVAIYGKVDVGVRKPFGSAEKQVITGGDSRLGFRGVESLGGGTEAFFQLEHRFNPDTGTQNGAAFWQGVSMVGLRGEYGSLGLGHQYVAAFSLIQNQIDPFGGDTVGELRNMAMRPGGITKVRTVGSLRYDYAANGFSVAATLGEADKNGGPDRPFSIAANYRKDGVFFGFGVEDPQGARDKVTSMGAGYQAGPVFLSVGRSWGTTNMGLKASGWMVGANYKTANGSLRAAYGKAELDGKTTGQKIGLGYYHSLSKRTTLYTNFGSDSKRPREKQAYDAGIIHTF